MTTFQTLRAPTSVKQFPAPDVFKSINANAITAGTPEIVWTPASGKRIRLMGWAVSTTGNAAVHFQDSSAAGTIIAQTPLLAAAAIDDRDLAGRGVLLSAVGNTLKIDVSANSTVSGMVWGIEE